MNNTFPLNCCEPLNDPKYATAIEALIVCYKDISRRLGISILNGGALGFYRYDIDSGDEHEQKMKLRIWPLGDEFYKKTFPKDERVIRTVLGAINKRRNYEILDHLVHFESKHNVGYPINKDCHYIIEFKQEDIINYDADNVVIDKSKYSWEEIATQLDGKGDFYKNHIKQLDHLLFSSGMSKILVIPIPVLSSPTILFFFNYEDFKHENADTIASFISELTESASEVVRFYLFNRVLIEFGREVNIDTIKTEDSLFVHFCERVANIFLPIKYKIDSLDYCNYFKWYEEEGNGLSNKVVLEFNNLDQELSYEHKLELVLPDYGVPHSENNGDVKKSKRLSELEYHLFSFHRIATTLNNIYHLIVKSWLPYERRNSLWVGKIEPVLEDLSNKERQFRALAASLNFDALNDQISELKEEVRKLNAGDNTSGYEFYKLPDDKWVFTFDGNSIIQGEKMLGLNIFHQILSNQGKQMTWEMLEEYRERYGESISSLEEFETGSKKKLGGKSENRIIDNDYEDAIRSIRDYFKVEIPNVITIHFLDKGRHEKDIEALINMSFKKMEIDGRMDNILKSLIENERFCHLIVDGKSKIDIVYAYGMQNSHKINNSPDINKAKSFIDYCFKFLRRNKKDLFDSLNNGYKVSTSGSASIENTIVNGIRKNLENALPKINNNEWGALIEQHFIDAGLLYKGEKGKLKLSEISSNRGPQYSSFKYEIPSKYKSVIKWRLTK